MVFSYTLKIEFWALITKAELGIENGHFDSTITVNTVLFGENVVFDAFGE